MSGSSFINFVDPTGRAPMPTENTVSPIGKSHGVDFETNINSEIFQDARWKFNSNSITVVYRGSEPGAVSNAMTNAFGEFTYFDYPKVNVDASGLTNGAGIVHFDPRGGDGVVNDVFGWIGGLYWTHDVTTYGSLDNSSVDQRAITNPGHGLVGIRVWGHNIADVPSTYANMASGDIHAVQAYTMAQETFNNLGGFMGGEARINSTAEDMWPDYLRDTIYGVLDELDAEPIDIIRESSNYNNPASPSFGNPFLRYIPEEAGR